MEPEDALPEQLVESYDARFPRPDLPSDVTLTLDKVLRHRANPQDPTQLEYLVKWTYLTASQNSWLPHDEVPHVERDMYFRELDRRQPSQEPLDSAALTRDRQGNEYAAALEKGCEELLWLVYDVSLKRGNPVLKGMSKDDFTNVGIGIIAAMPSPIVREIIGGNFAYAEAIDPEVRKWIALFHQRVAMDATERAKYRREVDFDEERDDKEDEADAKEHLAIHQRVLVDADGLAASPKTLQDIIDHVRAYPEDDGLAEIVDQMVGTGWNKPGRRYFEKVKINTAMARICGILERFCSAAENLIKAALQHRDQADKPVQSPWSYFGYANQAEQRNVRDHDKHINSSVLMMIVDATAQWVIPGKYRTRWFPVVLINAPEECSIAEIISTVISNGYHDLGTGLDYAEPGISVVCRRTLEQWNEYIGWSLANSPFKIIIETRVARFRQLAEEARQREIDAAKAEGRREGRREMIWEMEAENRPNAGKRTTPDQPGPELCPDLPYCNAAWQTSQHPIPGHDCGRSQQDNLARIQRHCSHHSGGFA